MFDSATRDTSLIMGPASDYSEHTIVFEGVRLPKAAIFLDHLGMYGNLHGMSVETSEWLWRFVICVGWRRHDSSESICSKCGETRTLLVAQKSHLVEHFPRHFNGRFEVRFYDDWLQTLDTIMAIARTRDSCSWIAEQLQSSPNFGRSVGEILIDEQIKLEHVTRCVKRGKMGT
jgi:hypothetical protein